MATTSRWHDGSRLLLRAVLILALYFFDACAAFMQQQPVWGRENGNINIRSKSSLEYTSPPSPFDTVVEAPSSSSKILIRPAPLPKEHPKEEKIQEFHWNDDDSDVTLIPMSTEPLMFWSSKPLLTPEECQVLSDYFFKASEYKQQQEQLPPQEKDSSRRRDSINDDVAKPILQRVWRHIDRLTFSPSHIGESSRPNYLFYSPEKEPTDDDKEKDNSWLFPNGLHVDTNNGKLFRHLTILLYLTTPHNTKGGATSFPLAKPIVSHHVSSNHDNSDDNDKDVDDENTLLQAADALVRTKLHHTQFSKNEQMKHYGHVLEDAAVKVFQRDEQHDQDHAKHPTPSPGLRVLPKAGHICVFSNLLDSGECDPRSFHGAEQLFQGPNYEYPPKPSIVTNEASMGSISSPSSSNKEVLTFFKEIPLQQFSNHHEFAQRVAESRRQLQQRYVL